MYDLRMDRLMTVPHTVQEMDVFWDIAFDTENNLYYSDGNTFWRWRLGAGRAEKLLRFQKAKGAPMGMGISPDGRFLSYYKYRADDRRFCLYDLETGESRDLRFSFYQYGWLDENHVAWTKMGGLKVLDVKRGTSRTVLRDYKAILKRCGGNDAARIDCFLQEESISEDLDLLGIHEGRLWFHLALQSFSGEGSELPACLKRKRQPLLRDGVWSVEPDGKAPRFHYETPKDLFNGYFSRSFRQGALCWIDRSDVLQSWNGVERRSFPAGWRPLLLPEDVQV